MIVSSQPQYAISYYDHKEDFYHDFMVGLLNGNQTWKLKSNREIEDGRSDITLSSWNRQFGIEIEIKKSDRVTDMEFKCEEALQQVADKRYAEELIKVKDTVWVYGIAFAGK